jgi:hypothetical protein
VGDRLHVDDRNVRVIGESVEDAVFAILLPVFELGKGADSYQVAVSGEDLGSLLDVLLGISVHHDTVIELERPYATGRRQHHRVTAKLIGSDIERSAGSEGVVEKEKRDGLPRQGISVRRCLEAPGLVDQCLQVGS